MSADNWAACPSCVATARAVAERQRTAAMESYGKVPAEQFQAAIAAIKDVDPGEYLTFREDYEIFGAEDGAVTVHYSGSCSECGTGLNFTDTHPIPGRPA